MPRRPCSAHPERSAPQSAARSRRPARAWLLLALLASGCQDYNFNPVGHCLLQPGSERITLSNLATADILFVVDDSGSMRGEQQNLAENFGVFVNELTQTNLDRIANQLEPLEFHIAITSTSVFEATSTNTTCRTDCSGANGELACCSGSGAGAVARPVYCESNTECSTNYTCRVDCPNFRGDKVCCDAGGFPQPGQDDACTTAGAVCGTVRDRYRGQFVNSTTGAAICEAGVGAPGAPYPAGDFVAAVGNPRVISFAEDLYPDTGPDTAAINARIQQFSQNILVGTCGSGQEQALEAARLAVKKALRQDGLEQPNDVLPESWPHPEAKLVVVFVGDEDDCSTPKDAPLFLQLGEADACTADTAEARRIARAEYVNFFRSLNRPFSAAFIESVTESTGGDWVPNVCCDPTSGSVNQCTGSESPGYRFTRLADDLRGASVEVVEGSVCGDFGTTLGQIAELVKPPTGLTLPTQPAATEVAVLRIASSDGETRKTCTGPAPAGTTGAALDAYDWWFTATAQSTAPSDASRFVFINHETANCEANPGETYSADYLGVVPQGGVPGTLSIPEESSPECAQALGGSPSDWNWYPVPGLASGLGTCVCG
jgi:hypothetical protein